MDIIVGVSDMKVSNARNAVLATYSLGVMYWYRHT